MSLEIIIGIQMEEMCICIGWKSGRKNLIISKYSSFFSSCFCYSYRADLSPRGDCHSRLLIGSDRADRIYYSLLLEKEENPVGASRLVYRPAQGVQSSQPRD